MMLTLADFQAAVQEGMPRKQLSKLIGKLPAADRPAAGRIFASLQISKKLSPPGAAVNAAEPRCWSVAARAFDIHVYQDRCCISLEGGWIEIQAKDIGNAKIKYQSNPYCSQAAFYPAALWKDALLSLSENVQFGQDEFVFHLETEQTI